MSGRFWINHYDVQTILSWHIFLHFDCHTIPYRVSYIAAKIAYTSLQQFVKLIESECKDFGLTLDSNSGSKGKKQLICIF